MAASEKEEEEEEEKGESQSQSRSSPIQSPSSLTLTVLFLPYHRPKGPFLDSSSMAADKEVLVDWEILMKPPFFLYIGTFFFTQKIPIISNNRCQLQKLECVRKSTTFVQNYTLLLNFARFSPSSCLLCIMAPHYARIRMWNMCVQNGEGNISWPPFSSDREILVEEAFFSFLGLAYVGRRD